MALILMKNEIIALILMKNKNDLITPLFKDQNDRKQVIGHWKYGGMVSKSCFHTDYLNSRLNMWPPNFDGPELQKGKTAYNIIILW